MSGNDLQSVKFHINVVGGFDGLYGMHYFKDGRSVEPVTLREAIRYGSIGPIVDDDGTAVTPFNQNELANRWREPETYVAPPVVELAPEVVAPAEVITPPVIKKPIFTQEQLEKIADAKGIAGLREISDPLGLKARSIPELIREILAEQRRETH